MPLILRQHHPRQFEHIGVVRHGIATGPNRIEFVAPIKDTTEANRIVQGSVVSLDQNGTFVAGAAAGTGINRPVPMIAMNNGFDNGVTTGELASSMAYSSYPISGGLIAAIPVTSGYEIETSEFDPDATYHLNDGLIPGTEAKLGKVTVATEGPGKTQPYLGFVSVLGNDKGIHKPPYKVKRIAFLACFIPAGVAQA